MSIRIAGAPLFVPRGAKSTAKRRGHLRQQPWVGLRQPLDSPSLTANAVSDCVLSKVSLHPRQLRLLGA